MTRTKGCFMGIKKMSGLFLKVIVSWNSMVVEAGCLLVLMQSSSTQNILNQSSSGRVGLN